MPELRHLFLVDELREAAEAADEPRLGVVRDIIREIKLSQLDKMEVASDAMVIEALEKLMATRELELDILREYLAKALQFPGPGGGGNP